MDISHNHHHHISPVAVIALLAGAGLFGLMQGGYLKGAFHKEILARIDPATVLTAADTIQEQRRATTPPKDVPVMVDLR
ncbi:hypothetical protein [Rhizobium lusitanum]|uniref:Uncharacterized protein n=1 Tax=Rhizobium lusitanum TaxID=293958 RepID=A0A7X0IR44_9HYPH|nr:hypothetical protein [Rhizobium lusitanum]MBB6485173.1 hypothetical protein [Rhizobium lusitanum]